MEKSSAAGFPVGVTAASNARTPQIASSNPMLPPAIDSIRLSTSNWRMTLQRPAPKATRMEISRIRPTARANCMFATFAQAISSTNPTAPSIARKMILMPLSLPAKNSL